MGIMPSDNVYAKMGAHEEGHDNFLWDCYTCQAGQSVMGPQSMWSSSQPSSPQECDLFWAELWAQINSVSL